MGNCCGKSSSDNFSSPGRTVGSAAAPANSDARVAVPSRASKPTYTQTPGRTVGGATGDAGGDARAAAAKAAEVGPLRLARLFLICRFKADTTL